MGAWQLGPRCNEAIGLRSCDVNPLRHDDRRNFARITPPAAAPALGDVLVAGRPDFWSWVVIDDGDGEIVYFRQVSGPARRGPHNSCHRHAKSGLTRLISAAPVRPPVATALL